MTDLSDFEEVDKILYENTELLNDPWPKDSSDSELDDESNLKSDEESFEPRTGMITESRSSAREEFVPSTSGNESSMSIVPLEKSLEDQTEEDSVNKFYSVVCCDSKQCNQKIPRNLVIETRQTFMELEKIEQDAAIKGHLDSFRQHPVLVCGGRLHATNRVKHLYSHARYGDLSYENDLNCEWTIEAEYDYNVHLTFLTFEVEDEMNCTYDFVDVYSGTDDSGQQYGRYCGNQIPSDIISTTEALLVRFKTDNTMTNKGFSASYVAVESPNSETSSGG